MPDKSTSLSPLWMGFIVSLTVNSTLGALLVAYSVLMALLGIGLSPGSENNYTIIQSIQYCWGYSPVLVNLPAFGYAAVTRRWRFAGGWLIGLFISILLPGLAVAAFALLIYLFSLRYS